jgi:hypothetical protein
MERERRGSADAADLDALIDEILVDANGDDEQLWAFRQAFEISVSLPADAFVIGEPVSVVAFEYDGNPLRGLTATCQRQDGSRHVVAAADVVLPRQSAGGRHVAAYRKWLGVEPFPPEAGPALGRKRQHKAAASDLDLAGPVELVVLSVKDSALRCRLLGSERVITLRAGGRCDVVPGQIAVVRPRRHWTYAGHPYLSGEIESSRLDVPALGLVPLALNDEGLWEPKDEYWGEEGEPIDEWAKRIIARGPRRAFEMEQVLPGMDPEDPFSDPILEANDVKDAGDARAARAILMRLCEADLRCLDAHAHLGNLEFEHSPEDAMLHYEVGVKIGELSLTPDFDGLLPWGLMDNRPFLRCLNGLGLCLWRLGRFEEAEQVFERMLSLNPVDNQGARFEVRDVRARRAWERAED